MRRILSLLCLALTCQAAVTEVIVLKDGRTLTGELTQTGLHSGKIALLSPKGAVVPVSLDDVQERIAYTAPIMPEPEPAPKRAPPVASEPAHAVNQIEIKIAAAKTAMELAQVDYLRAMGEYLHSLSATPIVIPALSADPKASEQKRRAEAELANQFVYNFLKSHIEQHTIPSEKSSSRELVGRLRERLTMGDAKAYFLYYNIAPFW